MIKQKLLAVMMLCGATIFSVIPTIAQRQNTYYRHYEEASDSLYNASIVSYGGNYSDRIVLSSPEAAQQRAQQLKDLGVTLVFYNGRHFRLSHENEWESIAQSARNVTDALHKQGIGVIEHHEFTVPAYNSYPIMLSHLDWLQRDVNSGELLRWMDPLNPQFLTFYKEYLANLQHTANFDGYMLDELALQGGHAAGNHEIFHKETEYEIPKWIDYSNPPNTPQYKAWKKWRSTVSSKSKSEIQKYLRRIRPDISMVSYSSDYLQSGSAARGVDLEYQVSRYASFMGLENMNHASIDAWRQTVRDLKLRQSFGDYFGIPTWAYIKYMRSKEAVYAGWIMAQLGKTSTWFHETAIDASADDSYLKRYNSWEGAMPHQYAKTLTDTGFLVSNNTRYAERPTASFYYNDFMGWADLLVSQNLQFDSLLDGDLALKNRLNKYQVLILASAASLDNDQIDHLQDWVKQGGTAIVTRNSSLYDEEGKQLSQFALGNAMNVRYRGNNPEGQKISGKIKGKNISWTARGGMYEVDIIAPSRSEVLAKSTSGTPAIILTNYGKGRFIYVAADIGTGNHEMRFYPPDAKYSFNEDAGAASAVRVLYEFAHRTPAPATLHLPHNVVGTVYQEQGGPQDGTIYVHLLNATGKDITQGDSVNRDHHPVKFPQIADSLQVILHAQVKGDIIAEDPLRRKKYPIEAKKRMGAEVIEIPGSQLQEYLQIRIPAHHIKGQTSPAVPVAR